MSKPPRIDANNIWKVVSHIEEYDVPEFHAVRYSMHLRYRKGEQPALFSCVITKQALANAAVTLRHMLAWELNKAFADHGMPETTRLYLTSEDAIWKAGFTDEIGWSTPPPAKPQLALGQTVLGDLSRVLPGIRQVVACPACEVRSEVLDVVQHLNDAQHRWSREQIADWLETLDVDLTFPSEPSAPLRPADYSKRLLIFSTSFSVAKQEAFRRRRESARWEWVSPSESWGVHRLQGMRDVQYCVVGPVRPSGQVHARLEAMEAIEVGEEEGPPVAVTAVADAEAQMLLYQGWANQVVLQGKPKVGKSYHQGPGVHVQFHYDEVSDFLKEKIDALAADHICSDVAPPTAKEQALLNKTSQPAWAKFNQPKIKKKEK